MNARYALLVVALAISTFGLVSPVRSQVVFVMPCGQEVPPLTPTQMGVWICVEGAIDAGITSAEFRVAGLPPQWTASVTPAPDVSTVNGDLFSEGVRVDFTACTGDGIWYLKVLDILLFPDPILRPDVLLMPAARLPVDAPPFDCSYARTCDSPEFTRHCLSNHGAILNPRASGCALPVATATWTALKGLYH